MSEPYQSAGKTDVVILVKATPHAGKTHGETVCCAGIDRMGNWLRLYPVSFRHLDEAQKFGRWDLIEFKWHLPKGDDTRIESRRVEGDSIRIVGQLSERERPEFLRNAIVTSVDREFQKGRSLALLQAEILEFRPVRRTEEEIAEEQAKFDLARAQGDLFSREVVGRYTACPYSFKYRYRSEDGVREGTCQDWELGATYFHWSRRYGEQGALDRIIQRFGVEYPQNGMLLAMGTHSRYPETWLINGIIRLDPIQQGSLF